MASSLIPPRSPLPYYDPILHPRNAALHPKALTSNVGYPLFENNPPSIHPRAKPSTAVPSASCPASLHRRLIKLEALLPVIHDTYQREISSLHSEIESLKGLLPSKTSLNTNAPPFVPGPAPMTPTTPADFKRFPHGLTAPFGNPDPDSSSSPPGSGPLDWLPHHEQVRSLSKQVNVLSCTMSQLLSTLLSSPNGLVTSVSGSPPTSNIAPHSNPPCRSRTLPISPPISLYLPNSASLPQSSPMKGPQSPSVRLSQGSSGNLISHAPLEPPLSIVPGMNGSSSLQSHLAASQPHPGSDTRLPRLYLPHGCQPPTASSTPISPLSHDHSANMGLTAPANSLAGKWELLGITGDVLRAIVRFGVGPPSKTQQKSIPSMLMGKDLVSQSNPIQERIQSYIIPALQLITNDMGGSSTISPFSQPQCSGPPGLSNCNDSVKVLVITATLDEAAQAHRLARGISALLPHPPKIAHCGAPETPVDLVEHPSAAHHAQPHLLIGTPSKLLDPVDGLRGYAFDAHSFICVILDEVDQLLARNLSDMVTSLMTFLPSNLVVPTNSSELSQSSPTSMSPSKEPDENGLHGSPFSPTEQGTPERRQLSRNSASSSSGSSDGKAVITGRQTCIFSCTVPQDVLSYARALNLRVKVIVRREDISNPVSTNVSSLIPSLDSSDARSPHLASFPWTNQSGNGNCPNTHQLLRNLPQFYCRARPVATPSQNARESKLRSLVELLFNKEISFLRAERGRLVIIYCNSVDSVEAVSFALGQNNIDVLGLHQDMGPAARHSLLSKFSKAAREPANESTTKVIKVLVVYDVLAKTLADISKDPPSLIINFELPRSVEDYIHRAGCIISLMNSSQTRKAGAVGNNDTAVINLVSAAGELETVRSIESFYRCKIVELGASSK